MEVRVKQDIPLNAYEEFTNELGPEFCLPSEPEREYLRSFDRPSFLEWLGSHPEWAILSPAAILFLKRLAEHAADDVWKHKGRILRTLTDPAFFVFRRVVSAIGKFRSDLPIRTTFLLILTCPDDQWGTALVLPTNDEAETA